MNLKNAVKQFIETMRLERNLSSNTLKAYQIDLALFRKWLNNDNEVSNIICEHIRSYLSHITDTLKYNRTTIRRKLTVLKGFFDYLESEDIIFKSPMRKIRNRYKIERKIPRILNRSELRKFFSNRCRVSNPETDIRNRSIIELLFATGIRVGELVALNLDNIDMHEGNVVVRGKGGHERVICFSSEKTKAILKDFLKIRRSNSTISNALFLNRFGSRLSATSIEKMIKKYQHLAGIKKKVTPHCFRHTMATMLLNNGADIRAVQEILGHASISTTQIYTYVSRRRQKQVMKKYNHRDKF